MPSSHEKRPLPETESGWRELTRISRRACFSLPLPTGRRWKFPPYVHLRYPSAAAGIEQPKALGASGRGRGTGSPFVQISVSRNMPSPGRFFEEAKNGRALLETVYRVSSARRIEMQPGDTLILTVLELKFTSINQSTNQCKTTRYKTNAPPFFLSRRSFPAFPLWFRSRASLNFNLRV